MATQFVLVYVCHHRRIPKPNCNSNTRYRATLENTSCKMVYETKGEMSQDKPIFNPLLIRKLWLTIYENYMNGTWMCVV